MRRRFGFWLVLGFAGAALQCGADGSRTLVLERQTSDIVAGRVLSEDRVLEFTATPSAPWAGDVALRVGLVSYDFHYDYELGQVIGDGHGHGFDRPTLLLLSDGVELLSQYLGPENAELAFHEQMLYAALVTWRESGGMILNRTTFELAPEETDKSLGNDGVTCIQSGTAYYVSYDYAEITVLDVLVQAGESDCNGMCGPSCTQLQPWKMWTLDCLEHDQCCRDMDDPVCWTPFGECGDEYVDAEADFLRGFSPFKRHCGG